MMLAAWAVQVLRGAGGRRAEVLAAVALWKVAQDRPPIRPHRLHRRSVAVAWLP